jgi:hypothetical protein
VARRNADYRVSGHGASVPRGLDVAPGRDAPYGRFGWMFPGLAACKVSDKGIDALVERMRRQPTDGNPNPCIPAGFTYLGQFIDHDITFDPVSSLDQDIDPHALVNFRTPRLDLDSVYGSGPKVQPYLYDWEESEPPGTRLLVGHNAFDGTDDLPRNEQGRAFIGDPRNDENAIVAQLHLLFIRFHNAVVDELGRGAKDLFATAQRMVRWHYQWIVAHEFLPKVVGQSTMKQVLTPRVHLEYFKWGAEPFIPVEFSGAAYRFGHSMARSRYGLRSGERARTLFPELAGLTWLKKDLVIDWGRFFKLAGEPGPQDSFRIDTSIAGPLFTLPDGDSELPRRNLKRGKRLGLPSGQAVASTMEQPALSEQDLGLDDPTLEAPLRDELLGATPLWYYVLCEAAKGGECNGRPEPGAHLGPVGGRIVAEVLLGLLQGDPNSYLSKEPTWQPTLGTGDHFTMADLIEFVRGS